MVQMRRFHAKENDKTGQDKTRQDKNIIRPRMMLWRLSLQTGRIDLWRGQGEKGNGVSIPTVCVLLDEDETE